MVLKLGFENRVKKKETRLLEIGSKSKNKSKNKNNIEVRI